MFQELALLINSTCIKIQVKRGKPEDQENLVKWDLLERMGSMEKRVVQDHQEVLVLQGSQVQGVSQA